nr:hypothetical protein [uncultured Rhodopila sp.]
MSVRIIDIREITKPIASPIRNAYIDFAKMTTSLVAVVTDAVRDGRRVVGYGFNSNGRYGQGGLIRERFAPRVLQAAPDDLLDASGENLDPDRIWSELMSNEKPGGHGERSVAVGTIDMAVWDAVAKIAGKPLFHLLAERHGRKPDPRVFVYAAGGYYYPGKGLEALRTEMRGYLDRGYTVVKMTIGGDDIAEDRVRVATVRFSGYRMAKLPPGRGSCRLFRLSRLAGFDPSRAPSGLPVIHRSAVPKVLTWQSDGKSGCFPWRSFMGIELRPV